MPTLGRVLVVDDEAAVAQVLVDIVVSLGYEARRAASGHEAISLVPVYRPDVVLLDLQMPGMPGDRVLDHLRMLDVRLPVVIVSGNRDVERARGTLAQGAFDYLAKPFELPALERVLAAAIAHRSRSD